MKLEDVMLRMEVPILEELNMTEKEKDQQDFESWRTRRDAIINAETVCEAVQSKISALDYSFFVPMLQKWESTKTVGFFKVDGEKIRCVLSLKKYKFGRVDHD